MVEQVSRFFTHKQRPVLPKTSILREIFCSPADPKQIDDLDFFRQYLLVVCEKNPKGCFSAYLMYRMMVEFKDKFQFFVSCSRSIIMRKVLSSKMFEKKTRKMVLGFYEDFYIPYFSQEKE